MLAWQRRRNRFNHDWLKNCYLPALEKLLNILDDQIDDPTFDGDQVVKLLADWDAHRSEAFSLPEEFIRDMSPRTLLEYVPLSNLEASSRLWLGQVTHCLWLSRLPISWWVNEALGCVRAADDALTALKNRLPAAPVTESLRMLRPLFVRFRGACQKLAQAIECFPSEVMVT